MGDEDNGGVCVGTEDDADGEVVTGNVGVMVGSVELTGGVGVGAKPGLWAIKAQLAAAAIVTTIMAIVAKISLV